MHRRASTLKVHQLHILCEYHTQHPTRTHIPGIVARGVRVGGGRRVGMQVTALIAEEQEYKIYHHLL